jgi:U3 small nucleolar RNA-associated protein 22
VLSRASATNADAGGATAAAATKVADVLRRAFADRAKVVSAHMGYNGTAYVDIGLIMDRANAARMVEHGPAADDLVAVKSFRQFWGSKSETRRFKDGRILESVVWEAEGL